MKNNDDRPMLTRAQQKLMAAADDIWNEHAKEKDAAYIARQLVQATLPHKSPGNQLSIWKRTNGNLTLAIQPGVSIQTGKTYGYPFGTIPRLLLFWMTTEALRTKSRRIELGHSLAGFMEGLGLNPDNGSVGAKRSDARRLKNQMERLFQARISFNINLEKNHLSGHAWLNMEVAPEGGLWWDHNNPGQLDIWESWIKLGEKFYKSIIASPVPVDIRALRALKNSALALDLYAWLTYESYKAHTNNEGRFVSWKLLNSQFGSDYSTVKNFSAAVRKQLTKIKQVYPSLQLGQKHGGVEILPSSFPAIMEKS